MILGVHNMFEALSHYTHEHMSAEGAWWILGLDGILLIPLLFAVFFYPMVVLIGVGTALILALGFMGLVHVMHAHQRHIGHH